MDVYMYQADLICEMCGRSKLEELSTFDEGRFKGRDSDHYPQGPYPDGGGEADCPNHCGVCGIFLENPLTEDGVEYLKECIADTPHSPVVQLWAEHYSDCLN